MIGFDNDGGLTGGIQTTGNYMGRARTPEQLMADMEEAMRLMPGTAKLNIHASYAIFAPGEFADRDALEPKHFAKWVEFAKKHHMGIDFNPTFFSHEKVKDGQTLSSPDEETRRFWINHGKACIRISEYFAKETGMPCVMNIWTGDGFKDVPADRMGPRMRYKDSIEQILSEPYDHNLVKPCVESKVFGIGVESSQSDRLSLHLVLLLYMTAVCHLWTTDIIIHWSMYLTRFRQCSAFIRNLHCISQGVCAGIPIMC